MYSELIKERIYIGGVAQTEEVVTNEKVDKVIDVRVNGRTEETSFSYAHKPIADEQENIAASIQEGVQEVVSAYRNGEKVYVHCGGGGGRACVMAAATLLELGEANSVDEAIEKVKEVRAEANIRPNMKKALEELYE